MYRHASVYVLEERETEEREKLKFNKFGSDWSTFDPISNIKLT